MIVFTTWFPFGRFIAIAIWPFIFTKRYLSISDIIHEKIHLRQQIEMLIIPFYILYLFFSILYGYKNNPFEKEAYDNERMLRYLSERKYFSWIKYL